MAKIKCNSLPEQPDMDGIYHLVPSESDDSLYNERTDRNIGWISPHEQNILRNATVGIAGLGGMGGLVAQTLLRLGVGTLKIADIETFDASNINRQFAATKGNIGKVKAFATANALRDIADDTNILIYPRGINDKDVDSFLDGCDIVCDAIEYWAVSARILLHQNARKHKIPLMNSYPLGFGTYLFFFTPESTTMEECMGLSYDEARDLVHKISSGEASQEDILRTMQAVMRGLVPDVPNYADNSYPASNAVSVRKRLMEEQKGAVVSTTPVLASGFIANHIMFYLLRESDIKRNISLPPVMPGYLYFDCATMQSRIETKKWW